MPLLSPDWSSLVVASFRELISSYPSTPQRSRLLPGDAHLDPSIITAVAASVLMYETLFDKKSRQLQPAEGVGQTGERVANGVRRVTARCRRRAVQAPALYACTHAHDAPKERPCCASGSCK